MVELIIMQRKGSFAVLSKMADRLNREVARAPRLDVYHTNLDFGASQFIRQRERRRMRERAEEITNA
jgi:hypothetical protein